jgi:hypothetical protein
MPKRPAQKIESSEEEPEEEPEDVFQIWEDVFVSVHSVPGWEGSTKFEQPTSSSKYMFQRAGTPLSELETNGTQSRSKSERAQKQS